MTASNAHKEAKKQALRDLVKKWDALVVKFKKQWEAKADGDRDRE